MKKYFVLYMAKPTDFKKVVAGMKKMTPAQMKEFNSEWNTWMKKNTMKGAGAPVGKNMRVWAKKSKAQANEVGGYAIVQADSPEAAAKKLQTSPHFKMIPKGWIDVMEVLSM